jgi:hypothetical protein
MIPINVIGDFSFMPVKAILLCCFRERCFVSWEYGEPFISSEYGPNSHLDQWPLRKPIP